jgi:hypothetical protein
VLACRYQLLNASHREAKNVGYHVELSDLGEDLFDRVQEPRVSGERHCLERLTAPVDRSCFERVREDSEQRSLVVLGEGAEG